MQLPTVKELFIEKNAEIFCWSRWGYFLASIILASFSAKISYLAFGDSQKYPELLVENIAWHYSNKFHDARCGL
jgi:hypothetical protein